MAELIQNAVDAINRTDPVVQGEIYLQIDCIRKEISIRDNGCGIAPEKLVTFLRPFSTDKLDDENQIGEKGVGLKFAYLKFIQAMPLEVRWQKFEMLDFGSYKPAKNL